METMTGELRSAPTPAPTTSFSVQANGVSWEVIRLPHQSGDWSLLPLYYWPMCSVFLWTYTHTHTAHSCLPQPARYQGLLDLPSCRPLPLSEPFEINLKRTLKCFKA